MNETYWHWLSVLSGTILIAAGLRDVFHTLFQPGGRGGISDLVSRAVWQSFLRLSESRRSVLSLAGSWALVVVLLTWAVLQALGWALVYWPFLPTQFLFATGMPTWAEKRFVDALYTSLVTLPTLGFGDITPTSAWLRLLAPVEAFIGFALLTAGLSWVLSIYPVLRRRRSFAHRVILAHASRKDGTLEWLAGDSHLAERLLDRLVEFRQDLMQFPITYYFRETDRQSSFPVALTLLWKAVDSEPELLPVKDQIRAALTDTTDYIGKHFLDGIRPPSLTIAQILAQHDWTEKE